MNRTKIEWTDYTWNPVTGCLNNCSYCYARRIAERFKGTKAWPNGFEPTVHTGRFAEPEQLKKPSKIFVCSMGELFGDWLMDNERLIIPDVQPFVLDVVRGCPQHTFQFLTKFPENLARWNPWPENAWVGVTATDQQQTDLAIGCLRNVQAEVRFMSFEPLLGAIREPSCDYLPAFNFSCLDGVIIGAETGNRRGKPQLEQVHEWAKGVIQIADNRGIPVFLKDNLRWPIERREWPERKP